MESTLFKVQTNMDGENWDDATGPLPQEEAIAKKREIDHNGGSDWGIDTRVVPATSTEK